MISKFSARCMHPSDWAAIKHFKPTEFKEPERMGLQFMVFLDELRTLAGVPMVITSSYRTPEHNASVGGAADSAHCDDICNAVDIGMRPRPDDPHWNRTRSRIVHVARTLGCSRFGLYKDGSVHIDRTEDVRPADVIWVAVDNPSSSA